jgi:hypothetical protein
MLTVAPIILCAPRPIIGLYPITLNIFKALALIVLFYFIII